MRWVLILCWVVGCSPVVKLQSPPALTTCTPAEIRSAKLPPYQSSHFPDFVTLQDGHFWVDEQEFTARGVNYYPSRYPWRRFLTELEFDTVEDELLLLRASGFNTLRLFLWNDALFQCPGSGAIPNPDAFKRLEAVMQAAADGGFRVIMTLNDLPDLAHYPLYDNPPHIQVQTRFLIERYRNETAILAWDLRNEGDIDYGSNNATGQGKFAREAVLDWLAETSVVVQRLDSNHLVTAGWLHDGESTALYVDFVSFHHWGNVDDLRGRINAIRRMTNKPILLKEFGYSTFRVSPEEQSRLIMEVVRASEAEGLLGWLIWTAFDFPLDATCIRPACPSQDNAEHHFGLWYPDYTAKPIVLSLLGR